MYFSMEMSPESFKEYLVYCYDVDKADMSKKGKLALTDWLRNVVEKAYEYQSWVEVSRGESFKLEDKTPTEWVELELERALNLPVGEEKFAAKASPRPEPAKAKVKNIPACHSGRMFSLSMSLIDAFIADDYEVLLQSCESFKPSK